MELIQVNVQGFRNIRKNTICLRELQSLLSLNSYGKSNLLHAIAFGIDFIHADSRTKFAIMGDSRFIPLTKATENDNFRIEYIFCDRGNGAHYDIEYGYEFVWAKSNGSGSFIKEEWLKVRHSGFHKKFKVLISRKSADGVKYRKSETGRCDSVLKIDPKELAINKFLAYDEWYGNKFVNLINNVRVYIDSHLDPSVQFSHKPFIPRNRNPLEIGVFDDLPCSVFYLKEKYPDRYAQLIDAYKQLFPQFKEITPRKIPINMPEVGEDLRDLPFTINNEAYILNVSVDSINQPLDFNNLSDGAKRVFATLTNLILADINNLILIGLEEPENSIHPGLFQQYIQLLKNMVISVKVVMTSHSPYLVQYQNPEDIYVGLPTLDGTAIFKRITQKKKLLNDTDDMDMSIGDYIFDLMSSREDYELINAYVES